MGLTSNYYENMTSKWGFDDGSMVPPEAMAVRRILIATLNAALGKDSPVAARAYDRPGVHNPCLLIWVNPASVPPGAGTDWYPTEADQGTEEPEGIDELLLGMDEEGLIDQCLRITVELDPLAPVLIEQWVREHAASLLASVPTCAICGQSGGDLVSSYVGDVHEHCAREAESKGGIVR